MWENSPRNLYSLWSMFDACFMYDVWDITVYQYSKATGIDDND